ncbi:YdcF family protein [Niastella populi]|uniref:DUF218 domain-containing protein n=1 Tax=Niastella populi TaxID=550983 RepID=A0A1V9FDT2_9BACT|nr:YdcF family protein [Niastella populi]OQP56529.1 hypothetical protein A4R26_05040 [Niastella populi]
MIKQEALTLAKKLWNYHQLQHKLEISDCILVLGSVDTRTAERGAEIYLQGYAPIIIFSGGLGKLTKDLWQGTEAELFATIALDKGVPREAIFIENKSTNTGENILFTQQLLQEKNLNMESFIVVQKPYMERRSYATFKKHWPNKKLLVTSPLLSFEEYPNDTISVEKLINMMVGDLQRIKLYPEKGFQVYQEIPDEVWQAYEELVQMGFNQQLVKGDS